METPLKIAILQKCFLSDPTREIVTKERKETLKYLLSLYKLLQH